MSHCGIFVDPSEYRRNNFDFAGDRLTALADLGSKDWITVLQTDVSERETRNLIQRSMKDACEELRKATLAPLKSIKDDLLDIFRSPPAADLLAQKLCAQFEQHLESASWLRLRVSDVDPSVIFDAYFSGQAPFDSPRKKNEFPDAFTHQRLVMWAQKNKAPVYVVGPDPDLKRICDARKQLRYFDKIEALLDYINSADNLVQRLKTKPQDLTERLLDFVRESFAELEFVLEFNPHGDVENVSVSDAEIGDIYALEVDDNEVQVEAEVAVDFTADFSYEDLDTGFYDKETGERYMTEYVHGKIEDQRRVSVRFKFSVDAQGRSVVSDISFRDDTVTLQEEDRGDYGAWK